MYFIVDFFIFLFGLIIGSFLNAAIYRLSLLDFSFWKSLGGRNRSYCPRCKHPLAWLDLVPVVSFLLLQGKCRYCHKKISWQYPIVEVATGLLFVLIFKYQFSSISQLSSFNYQSFIALCFMFYVSCSMIIIFVYDLKYYLIPDNILFPAIGVAFIFHLFSGILIGNWILGFGNSIAAAIVASGFFLCIYVVSRGAWMGFGDVKLAILLGLLLGWPNILVGLFLSFFFGAIIGVVLMLLSKKGLKSEIPFAPFLIAGTLVAMFWGEKIIYWYFNLFLFS